MKLNNVIWCKIYWNKTVKKQFLKMESKRTQNSIEYQKQDNITELKQNNVNKSKANEKNKIK